MSSTPLAVVILAHNEEFNLPDCLESLRGLDCSTTVVDSGSTDRTVEIARSYSAQVLSHPFQNYSAQRNWAQSNLPFETTWVLHLDADERLTPELVTEINGILHSSSENADGFLLRKRTVFLGRWIRHGAHYPSYHLRLFRKAKGRCEAKLYDQHFITSGITKRLENDYYDVIATDLSTWTSRHRRWAELEVQETFEALSRDGQVEPKLLGSPIERKRWLRTFYSRNPLFLRAFTYWLYRYLFRLGFLDGTEGLIFHFLQGFWFRFLVDSMIFEHRRSHRVPGPERAVHAPPPSPTPLTFDAGVTSGAPTFYNSSRV
jgi:glycosyltransferase involved in cell wall biosynthesis